jgi:YbbR domain-containing protein
MSLHTIFLHNFLLKFFSVLVATLIWLAVDASLRKGSPPGRYSTADVNHRFPRRPVLVMTGAGEHPALTLEPSDVSVLVRGPASALGNLKEQDVQVFLDLKGQRELSGDFPVVVHAPPGVTEVYAFPERVTVRPTGRP